MNEFVEYKVAPSDQPPLPMWDLIGIKDDGGGKIIAAFYDARVAERVKCLLSEAASEAKPRSGARLQRRVGEARKRRGTRKLPHVKGQPK